LTTAGIGGRVYNIGAAQALSVNQIAERLRSELGAEVEISHGPDRRGDVRHSVADITAARAELGYEPSVTLDEGITRTVKYYIEQELEERRRPSRTAPVTSVHTPTLVESKAGPKRYLITGGAGFIGSFEQIVVLDDLSTGAYENIEHLVDGERMVFVRGSVTDADTIDELMRNADQCIHLASAVGVQMIVNEPLDTLMKSVRGSNVVMHAATRNNVRVLFSSTSEVYGKQSHKLLSEQDDLIFGSPSKGRWTYAIAKSFGEALIHGYHRQRGANATIVRLFNCVGPRQTATYATRWVPWWRSVTTTMRAAARSTSARAARSRSVSSPAV
jgi:nucleoside-diphosphate-sugar epimerase